MNPQLCHYVTIAHKVVQLNTGLSWIYVGQIFTSDVQCESKKSPTAVFWHFFL